MINLFKEKCNVQNDEKYLDQLNDERKKVEKRLIDSRRIKNNNLYKGRFLGTKSKNLIIFIKDISINEVIYGSIYEYSRIRVIDNNYSNPYTVKKIKDMNLIELTRKEVIKHIESKMNDEIEEHFCIKDEE